MTTQELMQPFCAVGDVRAYLNHIFKKGEFLCASNGHVFIRVQNDGTVEVLPESEDNKTDDGKILNLEAWPTDGFIPLEFSAPDIIEQCSICEGTGKTFEKEECDECDGKGEFKHGSHYYSCDECDGDGKVQASFGDKIACVDCHATGIKYQYLTIPDGRVFNYTYMLKLQALPGIIYLPDHSDSSTSMRFKFDNGVGLLMPIRR